MAHDGYRTGPDQHQSLFDYSDPRAQYPVAYDKPKSRQSSRDRGDMRMPEQTRHPQPHHHNINEAVSAAYDKSDPTTSLNPDLIAHITETVIKQLRTTTIDANTPVQSVPTQYPPPPTHQPVPLSPSTQSGASPPMPTRNVYTPPSPHKHYDNPIRRSPENHSTAYAPPSPKEPPISHFEDRRPSSRLSSSSDPATNRPRGPARLSTAKEETTLEKIWGQLFDEEGHPTIRLGQFLRGLATHLVRRFPLHKMPSALIVFYRSRTMNLVTAWSSPPKN